jgi:pyruvate dehydrogenase E1 component beta subunit
MPRLSYQQAIVRGIAEEMRRDPRVFVLGQDIGAFGGPMQSTKGLWEEFGASGRVIDAGITEAAMVGGGVGAALTGMRPVVELMFGEFLSLVVQHLAGDAAAIHYLSGNRARVPLVVRVKYGVGPHLGHKQDYSSWFAHVPGLKVALPSSPRDARGLIKAAIRDENPVVFFEHMQLYHGQREEVPEAEEIVPLGKAQVRVEGRDLTIVAAGLMSVRAAEAARQLRDEGLSVEVVDLRCARPLDADTILASVRKTRRLLVVTESWVECGLASEIVALVAERALDALLQPPVRLGPRDTHVPFNRRLEELVVPTRERIAAAALTSVRREAPASAPSSTARSMTATAPPTPSAR